MAKDEQGLFITGIIGVVGMIALIILVPCPTPMQGRFLLSALGLMGALVAAQIPGVLDLQIAKSNPLPIKAGGAIAVFILIAFVNPDAFSNPTDESFSKLSCQGPLPQGKELKSEQLPEDLNPTVQTPIDSKTALGRPVRFSFEYPFGEFKGTRYWSQVKDGVWIETYPNGALFSPFREVGRETYKDCKGIVVERQDSTAFQVFIPDKICTSTGLWHRQNEGEWAFLGTMDNVE